MKISDDNIVTNSGTRAGMDNPTISFTVQQWFNTKGFPPGFAITSPSNPYYDEFCTWFVDYHEPYCQDFFDTNELRKLDDNDGFHELVGQLLHQYQTNVDRVAANVQRGIEFVNSCIVAVRSPRQVMPSPAPKQGITAQPPRVQAHGKRAVHTSPSGTRHTSHGVQKPRKRQITLTQLAPNSVTRVSGLPKRSK